MDFRFREICSDVPYATSLLCDLEQVLQSEAHLPFLQKRGTNVHLALLFWNIKVMCDKYLAL